MFWKWNLLKCLDFIQLRCGDVFLELDFAKVKGWPQLQKKNIFETKTWFFLGGSVDVIKNMDVSKNMGWKTPKIDGENKGQPY